MRTRRPAASFPPSASATPVPVSASPASVPETLAAIGPIARSSVVDAVADRLQDEILSGRLAAGTRLPSEREFSLALGVNRLTLRAALARLEALGMIVTRHGAGTLVASWRERAGLEALAALIGSSWSKEGFAKGHSGRDLLTAMLEVRRIVASEAIGLAAKRHTAADLDALEQRAREQEARVHDRVAFARGDIAFERALIRATRNVGLELLLNTFARFPDEQPELVAELYDRPEDALSFYPFIIGLIRAGDPVAARDTMKQMLEALDVEWQARHAEPSLGAGATKPASKSGRRKA